MKKKIFIDTNILISGIFFQGNEAKLLKFTNIELVTSDIVIEELKEVVLRKFTSLNIESLKIALMEIENSIKDIKIIKESFYLRFITTIPENILKEKDRKILAAALYTKSDYFISGDKHFYNDEVKKKMKVRTTREILLELKIL